MTQSKTTEWAVPISKRLSFSNSRGDVGFRLRNGKDVVMHLGREFLRDALDWVGLEYEINPAKSSFEYDIEILGDARNR